MDTKIQIVLERVIAALNPEAIYLFGSRARGDATPMSDYDLVVLVPDGAPKEKSGHVLPTKSYLGLGLRWMCSCLRGENLKGESTSFLLFRRRC